MSQVQQQQPQPMPVQQRHPQPFIMSRSPAPSGTRFEEPVRLLIQGATPGEEARPDYRILLAELLNNQGLGYRVIDELVHYAATAPHVVAGLAVIYPDDLGTMGLPASHPWLRMPNIFLIETAAQSVTRVTGALYRLFGNPAQPNLFIEAIEIETTLVLSLSTKIGTGFNLAGSNAMHGAYKSDMLWKNTNAAGASITGNGVTVAVLDSGCLTAFGSWHDFTDPPSGGPVDIHGHGTAMTEIIHDLAPDADLHVMRVARNGTLGLFDLMAALLTAVVHVRAHVVNMSLGVRSSVKPCASCGAVGVNRSTVFEYWFKGLAAGASVGGGNEPVYSCAVGNSGSTADFDWPAAFDPFTAHDGGVRHDLAAAAYIA